MLQVQNSNQWSNKREEGKVYIELPPQSNSEEQALILCQTYGANSEDLIRNENV